MRLTRRHNIFLLIFLFSSTGCASIATTKGQANYQQAQQSLSRGESAEALKLGSMNPDMQLEYANFLCTKANNYGAALYYYNKLQTSINQLTLPAHYFSNYADCQLKHNNTDAALNLYTTALSYESAPFSAYAGIVAIYTRAQNYAIANYYAQLYTGPVSRQTLLLQIQSLANLLNSNINISDPDVLSGKLTRLKAQYSQLGGDLGGDIVNPVNDVAVNPVNSNVAASSQSKRTAYQNTTPTSNSIKIYSPVVKANSSGRKYLIVTPSATLYSISRISNVPLDQLRQLNNIENNKIVIGQKIYLD